MTVASQPGDLPPVNVGVPQANPWYRPLIWLWNVVVVLVLLAFLRDLWSTFVVALKDPGGRDLMFISFVAIAMLLVVVGALWIVQMHRRESALARGSYAVALFAIRLLGVLVMAVFLLRGYRYFSVLRAPATPETKACVKSGGHIAAEWCNFADCAYRCYPKGELSPVEKAWFR